MICWLARCIYYIIHIIQLVLSKRWKMSTCFALILCKLSVHIRNIREWDRVQTFKWMRTNFSDRLDLRHVCACALVSVYEYGLWRFTTSKLVTATVYRFYKYWQIDGSIGIESIYIFNMRNLHCWCDSVEKQHKKSDQFIEMTSIIQ